MPGDKPSYPDLSPEVRPEYRRPGSPPRGRRRCNHVSLAIPADRTKAPEIVTEMEDPRASLFFEVHSLSDAYDLYRMLGDRLREAGKLGFKPEDGRRHDA